MTDQLQDWLTDDDRSRVEMAVRNAEAHTSAEIVPVVALSSGRYHRAQDIAGVWLAMIGFVVLGLLSPDRQVDLWEGFIVLCFGLALGALIAHVVTPVRRALAGKADMSQQVLNAAFRAFRTHGVGDTAGRTGILIYVSLFEHMAVVLGDTALGDKLKAEDYASIRNALLEQVKAGKLADGLIVAVMRAGALLEPIAPRAPGDVDEVPNSLRVLA